MKRIGTVLLAILSLMLWNVSYAEISKNEAVDIAIDALITHFDVQKDDFIHNNLDVVFTIDTENNYGAPTDQPYWKVRFGWGQAYGVAISSEGDLLALQGPGTPFYPLDSTIFDNCTPAMPNEESASRQTVTETAIEALQLQAVGVDVGTLSICVQFVDSEWYMWGEEPVWIVTLSADEKDCWYVLLSNEGLVLDIASNGKLFDCSCYLH